MSWLKFALQVFMTKTNEKLSKNLKLSFTKNSYVLGSHKIATQTWSIIRELGKRTKKNG